MTDSVNQEPCEIELEQNEDLYRQIPTHLWDGQAGRPLASAFGPSDADKGKPSYSRSTLVSAQASRDWHNENARSTSRGVYKVTVDEVVKADLKSFDDSKCPVPPGEKRAPGHCYVDFQHLAGDKKEERRLRGLLYARALAWGKIETQSRAEEN